MSNIQPEETLNEKDLSCYKKYETLDRQRFQSFAVLWISLHQLNYSMYYELVILVNLPLLYYNCLLRGTNRTIILSDRIVRVQACLKDFHHPLLILSGFFLRKSFESHSVLLLIKVINSSVLARVRKIRCTDACRKNNYCSTRIWNKLKPIVDWIFNISRWLWWQTQPLIRYKFNSLFSLFFQNPFL